MKKLVFLTLLGLGLHTVSVAQSDFRPGYIVQPSGDTLRGEVDYRGEQRNTRLCSFRATAAAPATDYQPEQLRGYGFAADKHYQTRQLAGNPPVAVFAQTLVGGKVSLFRLTNTDGKEVYYAGTAPAEPLRLLQQRDTVVSQNVRQRVYPFRNVLRGLMLDCPAVQAPLARTELVESQLVKVFTTYNACVGAAPQYVVAKQPSRLNLGVLVGVHQASMVLLTYGNQKLSSSFKPTLGLGLAWAPNSFSSKLSLHLQALYVRQEFDKQYQSPGEGIFSGENVQRSVRVHVSSVRVPGMLRYTLPKGRVRPYVQAGVMYALNYDRQGSQSWVAPRIGSVATQEIELTNYSLGFLAGAGVSVPFGTAGALQVEVRADKMDDLSQTERTLGSARGLSVLAGYTFGNMQR